MLFYSWQHDGSLPKDERGLKKKELHAGGRDENEFVHVRSVGSFMKNANKFSQE